MLDKKEIGRKIWELFSKNYSYSDIAKELGISKSVVSNVINYTLPARNWIQEDLKELKQKHKEELKQLKQNCINFVEQEKNKIKKTTIKYSTILTFYITFFFVTSCSYKIKIFNLNGIYLFVVIIAITTVIITVYYFLLKFLFKE